MIFSSDWNRIKKMGMPPPQAVRVELPGAVARWLTLICVCIGRVFAQRMTSTNSKTAHYSSRNKR
jgi:hypothetical protein